MGLAETDPNTALFMTQAPRLELVMSQKLRLSQILEVAAVQLLDPLQHQVMRDTAPRESQFLDL